MKKCLIFVFLACSVLHIPAQTAVIKKIQFHGNKRVATKELQSWFESPINSRFTIEDIHRKSIRVLEEYSNLGLLFVEVDSVVYHITPDSSGVTIDIYIDEGPEVTTGRIQLTGIDSSRGEAILNRFDSRPGKKFDQSSFSRDLDDALLQLEKDGYPFCRFDLDTVTLDSIAPDKEAFGVILKTATGPQLIIEEIAIEGNQTTKDYVILREIRIKRGSIYDINKVAQISAKLLRLGFFKRVEEPQVFLASENKGGLVIRVEEGNSSTFDGVIGYTPGTGDEKGYFTGLIDVSLGNLLGTGRSLLAHWQKRTQKTQDLKFHYREPWVLGLPLSVGLGFEQLIQDTTYIDRKLGLDMSLPVLDNFTIIASGYQTDIIPDSLGSHQLGIPRSRALTGSIGIQYDTRDDLLNPIKGVFYQTTVESGVKENLGPASLLAELDLKGKVNNKRLSLDVEFYAPLLRRQVLAVSLHGRQIRSSETIIPLPDQYRLGGTRTLRGYREDQFRGSAVAWSNLELRYILGRRSRVFAFWDNGYYTSPTESGKKEGMVTGYGVGFRLETGLGIMGIDYGLGKGDDLMNGKLHIGLINEF